MSDNNSLVRSSLKNISYTFIAQGITLAISLIKALWIPKILGVEQFSYWQLFLFYSGYVGFFQFGLNDGIYLRYGGKRFSDLNKTVFRSQFWILVVSQLCLTIMIIVFSELFVEDGNRVIILMATSACMIVTGVAAFFWFTFQSTNRIKEYALSLVIEKVMFVIIVLFLLVLKITSFKYFIIADLVSRTCGLIFLIVVGKDLIVGKCSSYRIAFSEAVSNISIGMQLMLANIASMLILGVGRFIIDYVWGVTAFGEFSLALSVVSMILLFINAVSIVLFPALRRVPADKLSEMYVSIRTALMLILLGVLIVYTPIQYILNMWLPEYARSLKYLAILFPIFVFDGKMQMLIATYLKVLRKEGILLKINMVSVVLSVVACSFAAVVIHNINFVIISMVIVVIVRCVIAELYLSLKLRLSVMKILTGEIILVIVFMVSSWYLEGIFSLVVYSIAYLIFVYFSRQDLSRTLGFLKRVCAK